MPPDSPGPGSNDLKIHTVCRAPLSGRVKRLLLDRLMTTLNVVALWEAFYVENKRFDLDTLRVPNRSPTTISKSNDFRGQSEDIWGARALHFRPMLSVTGVRVSLKNTYVWAL